MKDRKKKRKEQEQNLPRQNWQPHWSLRLLRSVWMVVFAVFKIAVAAAATVLCICMICLLVFVGILGDYLQEDIVPTADLDLENFDLDQTSFMYYVDSDGQIQQLQQIYTTTDRQWVAYEEIPEDLVHAAVAIEDKRFYEHQGVDWLTTVKAFINMFFGGSSSFGGSTITQQLIKNVTGEDSVTIQRKVLEIFRAQQFERKYSKETILEWYLNGIFLGEGCYGVKSASAAYFGKELEDLTIAECASLVSITNNPSLYDPYIGTEDNPDFGRDNNRKRQLYVLGEMLTQEWISQEEYDEAVSQEMVFKRGISQTDRNYDCANPSCDYSGKMETYETQDGKFYCPVCGTETNITLDEDEEVYSWFVDTVLEDVARDLAEKWGMEWNEDTSEVCLNRIKRGGYHIYTTLNMEVQDQVDRIYEDLNEIPETRSRQQLQAAMVVVDNSTGDVVAMSGGVGEKKDFDAFNRATEADLQTGSSIKPLTVYAPAFELGVISPATVIKDLPMNYDDGVFPVNDTYSYSYSRTILDGIIDSVNAVAVNTLDLIGTRYSFDFAKEQFGLAGLTEEYVRSDGFVMSDVGYSPLGMGALTWGVSVRDMTCAYATFANNGVYRKGRTYTKVYDSDGNLVLDNVQETRQILSEKTVNYMNYCLDNAVNSGTGTAADLDNMAVAGKTGSTSDWKDRWFCGFTGYYTAAVWCGYDTPEHIYLEGSYANPACRLWKKVMAPLHEGLESIPLYSTAGFSYVSMCLDSGKRATDACSLDVRTMDGESRVSSAYADWDDVTGGTCDKHILVDYCLDGNGVATEYCKAAEAKIEKRALVKMTQDELDEILKAGSHGLDDSFLKDNYIYLVNSAGEPAWFKGLHGNINQTENLPYATCTVHTAQTVKPTEPSEPSEPGVTSPLG